MPQTIARPAVHELQEMAQAATLRPRPRRSRLSRAARLELIDLLSRWAGAGLALFAGVAIFVAVAARDYPFRASVWILLVLAALSVCRRLHRAFRFGERRAARPFRWRADYTASVAVLSAAFGAGSVIVLPEGVAPALAAQSLALMGAAAFGTAAAHAPHGRSASAAAAPAALFLLFAAWRTDAMPVWAAGFAIAIGGAALFLINRYLRERAIRRHPRTAFVRREIGRSGETDFDLSARARAGA